MTDIATAVSDQYGSVEMVIVVEEQKVIQRFAKPMAFVVYDPPNCLAVAEALTAASFEADTRLKPVGETLKASLVAQHRQKLIPRVRNMLSTMREDKLKTDQYIAENVIDAIFHEVFV